MVLAAAEGSEDYEDFEELLVLSGELKVHFVQQAAVVIVAAVERSEDFEE